MYGDAMLNQTRSISAMHPRRTLQDECHDLLEAALAEFSSIVMLCMARVDGMAFASACSAASDLGQQRSSAIVSSLLALSESFARETLRSKCLYTTIATQHGFIVTVRVPCKNEAYALCLCADSSENLAIAIRAALDTAEALAGAVDAR